MAQVQISANRAKVEKVEGNNGEMVEFVSIVLDLRNGLQFQETVEVKNVTELERFVLAIHEKLRKQYPNETFKLHLSAIGRKISGFDKARPNLSLLHVAQ